MVMERYLVYTLIKLLIEEQSGLIHCSLKHFCLIIVQIQNFLLFLSYLFLNYNICCGAHWKHLHQELGTCDFQHRK